MILLPCLEILTSSVNRIPLLLKREPVPLWQEGQGVSSVDLILFIDIIFSF